MDAGWLINLSASRDDSVLGFARLASSSVGVLAAPEAAFSDS